MNYEKAYKDALKRAKKLYEQGTITESLSNVFPELKESEEERIRNQIINFIEEYGNPIHCEWQKDWIAWLEKQGEKKPIDKVEPKFKVGDFIANDYCFGKVIALTDDAYLLDTEQGIPFSCEHNAHLWTIADAKDGDVLSCDSKHGQEIGIVKKYIGKYGGCDICFETYCFVDWDGIFRIGEYMGSQNIHPATKEQRALLFAKMKDAGYEWDAEKKELKKIENSPILSNSAKTGKNWSDDDEQYLLVCKNALRKYQMSDKWDADIISNWLDGKLKQGEQKPKWSYEDEANLNNIIWLCNNCLNGEETTWIPSQAEKIKHLIETIKERGLTYQKPKWSEEDEKRIERICNFVWKNRKGDTDEIYQQEQDVEWLKSLKQRMEEQQ